MTRGPCGTVIGCCTLVDFPKGGGRCGERNRGDFFHELQVTPYCCAKFVLKIFKFDLYSSNRSNQ